MAKCDRPIFHIKNNQNMTESKASEDKPPILGSWNRLYALVIILHIVIISLFVLFTRYYS